MIASSIPLKTESGTGKQPPSTARGSTNDNRLSQFLKRIRKRARRWIFIDSISLIGLSVAVWFWGTLFLDWLIEPPPIVRLLAVGILCLQITTIVLNRLVRRLRAPLHDEQLALLAERTHPELQDCLSTAIELRGSKERSTLSTIDVTLLDRTTSIAASSIKQVDLSRLFRRTHLLRKAGLSGFSIGTMAAVLVLLPTIRETWVNRMLLLSDTPWPRQVTLSIAGFPNGVRRVPRGVDVEILVTALSTGQIPEVVELQHRGKEGWTTHRMGTRGSSEEKGQLFTYIIKKPQEDLTIEIRGGDGRLRDLYLDVVEPPSLAEIRLQLLPLITSAANQDPLLQLVLLRYRQAPHFQSRRNRQSRYQKQPSVRSKRHRHDRASLQAREPPAFKHRKKNSLLQNSRLIYPKHRNKKVLSTSNHDASPELLARSLTTPSWTSNSQIQLVSQTKNPFVSRYGLGRICHQKLKSRLMASRRSSQHLQRFRLLAELKMIMGSPRQQFLFDAPQAQTPQPTLNCSRYQYHSPPNYPPFLLSSKKHHPAYKLRHCQQQWARNSN